MAVPHASVQSVTPEMLNQPVDGSDVQSSGSAEEERLRVKLGLANSQARDAKNEAAATRKQIQQLQDELQAIKSAAEAGAAKQLEDQGAFKSLWEQAKATIKDRDSEILELKGKLSNVQQSAEQERLRAELVLSLDTSEGKQKAINNCLECHDLDNSPQFDFDEYWPSVDHSEEDE